MGVTSIGGHTRPDCNARYNVRIKIVETWLFVCLTWCGNVGRLFAMVLHVVLTPWMLIGREWINSVTCLKYSILVSRFSLPVSPSVFFPVFRQDFDQFPCSTRDGSSCFDLSHILLLRCDARWRQYVYPPFPGNNTWREGVWIKSWNSAQLEKNLL